MMSIMSGSIGKNKDMLKYRFSSGVFQISGTVLLVLILVIH